MSQLRPAGVTVTRLNRNRDFQKLWTSIANANGSTFRMMAAVSGIASTLIFDPKTLIRSTIERVAATA